MKRSAPWGRPATKGSDDFWGPRLYEMPDTLPGGDNSEGQLGDGTTTNRATPVQVPGLTGVTAVAAGAIHSLVLRNDGTVWAWGPGRVSREGVRGFESNGALYESSDTFSGSGAAPWASWQRAPTALSPPRLSIATARSCMPGRPLASPSSPSRRQRFPSPCRKSSRHRPSRMPRPSSTRGSQRRQHPLAEVGTTRWCSARTAPSGPGATITMASSGMGPPPAAPRRCWCRPSDGFSFDEVLGRKLGGPSLRAVVSDLGHRESTRGSAPSRALHCRAMRLRRLKAPCHRSEPHRPRLGRSHAPLHSLS